MNSIILGISYLLVQRTGAAGVRISQIKVYASTRAFRKSVPQIWKKLPLACQGLTGVINEKRILHVFKQKQISAAALSSRPLM